MAAPEQTREKVWKAMAEHFLDTETRHQLPYTAWVCVEGGFSLEESYAIWCREIIPVVGPNLLSVAGEWAGWNDHDLLTEARAMQQKRRVWSYPCLRRLVASEWTTIAACYEVLKRAPSADVRLHQQRALEAAARHLVDFVTPDPAALPSEIRSELTAFGLENVWSLLSPALHVEEHPPARERLGRVFETLAG